VVRRGDTIVSTVRTYLKAVYFVEGLPEELVCSTGFAVLTPRNGAAPKYVSYLAQSNAFTDRVTADSVGVAYPGIAETRLGSFHVAVPPFPEQSAIVRYLDHVDRRIRKYIRAKQKLIALLNEQKQAIIHRAVTGQIDVRTGKPYPKYKPSGVPWLGDVPEHWEVSPLKRIAWFKSGAGFPIPEQGQASMEIPFLKVSDMTRPGNERLIQVWANTVSPEAAARLGAHVFPAGTIVFPKVGGALLTNKRRLLSRPSCIDNNMMGCVVRRGVLDYAFILMEHLDLGRLSNPGPVPATNEGEVRDIKVALPPETEQRAIARATGSERNSLDMAEAHVRRQIEVLQEYRTRLVADVVTGKLDVREAAANLPEELEEVEEAEVEAQEELEGAAEEAAESEDAEGQG